MALPASDNFTTGTDQALTAYSANWAATSQNMYVFAAQDAITSDANDECCCRWAADAFGNDHYAQATYQSINSTNWTGVAVRAASGAATYYGFYAGGATQADSYLFKMVAGVFTQIGPTGAAWASADVIRLEVSSTTLTPKRNGATYASIGAQTDSAIASGSAGVSGYGLRGISSPLLDDWSADNLGAPASGPAAIMTLRTRFWGVG